MGTSAELRKYLAKCRQHKERVKVPEWDSYFIDLAYGIAARSSDGQTQVGAIIVNGSNEIVTTGYNGFMRGANDNLLPNLRPLKYPWMIHAEHNAILSAARQGKSLIGCKVYCTMHPCVDCSQFLWQTGIDTVYYREACSAFKDKEHLVRFETFQLVTQNNMKFIGV